MFFSYIVSSSKGQSNKTDCPLPYEIISIKFRIILLLPE